MMCLGKLYKKVTTGLVYSKFCFIVKNCQLLNKEKGASGKFRYCIVYLHNCVVALQYVLAGTTRFDDDDDDCVFATVPGRRDTPHQII